LGAYLTAALGSVAVPGECAQLETRTGWEFGEFTACRVVCVVENRELEEVVADKRCAQLRKLKKGKSPFSSTFKQVAKNLRQKTYPNSKVVLFSQTQNSVLNDFRSVMFVFFASCLYARSA